MKKYPIYIFVILVVILGGALYFFSDKKDIIARIQDVYKDVYKKDAGIRVINNGNNKDAPIGPVESVDFNDAMKRAQEAFGKKEYDRSINYYKEALTFEKSDKAYSGLYVAFTAQQDWAKAVEYLGKAIEANALNGDYRKWQLTILDEKTNATFTDLKKLYDEAMPKIDPRARVDLTTHFARLAGNSGEKVEAVLLWEKAKVLYPDRANIYQTEIDKLK